MHPLHYCDKFVFQMSRLAQNWQPDPHEKSQKTSQSIEAKIVDQRLKESVI